MAQPTTTGRRSRRKLTAPSAPTAEATIPPKPTIPKPAEPADSAPAPVHVFRWPWYLLSAFIPFAGMVVGLFLYEHESREVRRIGRNSLLIGFVVWVLVPMALFILLSLLTAVAAMDWIANLLPPGN